MRTTPPLARSGAASAVLVSAAAARRVADAQEVQIVRDAVAWARLHVVDEVSPVSVFGGPVGITLGGEGVPLIDEWCVSEFAAVVGLSTDAGLDLFAEALELSYRLPRVWARVEAGAVTAWRARRIARETVGLSAAAVGFVDAQVANYAHSIGPAAISRLVTEALWRFDPERLHREAALAGETRFFDVDHRQVTAHGTSRVCGELDLADALDLDRVISAGAEQLKLLGSTDPLDARRAQAMGELARRQLAFGFETEAAQHAAPVGVVTRQVMLHVHISAETLAGEPGSGFGRVETTGTKLVTADQVAAWCGTDATRVVVRPVIDLNAPLASDAYEIPDRVREQVMLRDRHCVFPWCTRSARTGDIDHIVPWSAGGPTTTGNLAALCRRHHRYKTHHGWTYQRSGPATYEWTSPLGRCYLVDPTGTTPLDPERVRRAT